MGLSRLVLKGDPWHGSEGSDFSSLPSSTEAYLLGITSHPSLEKLEASVCCSQSKGALLSRRARRTAGSLPPNVRKRKSMLLCALVSPGTTADASRRGSLASTGRSSASDTTTVNKACRMAVLHVPTRQAPQSPQCQESDPLRYLIIRHTAATTCVQ